MVVFGSGQPKATKKKGELSQLALQEFLKL